MRTRALILVLVLCSVPAWAQVNFLAKADVVVTGTATLVLAKNSFRYALNCTNTHATVHVRWGDSTVTATKGQRIPAGSAVEIRSTGAVYMISEGADVTVSCTEETK